MSGQGLKVPVSALIERAEQYRAKLIAEHAKTVAAWKANRRTAAAVRADLVSALRRQADDIEAGRIKVKTSNGRYNAQTGKYDKFEAYSAGMYVPGVEPRPAKVDTRAVDRDLKMLRLTSQDSITVRSDSDFARYL